MIFKPITSKIKIKGNKIIFENELGFKETFRMEYNTFVDTNIYNPKECEMCKKGIPEHQTNISFIREKIEKTKHAVTNHKKLVALMKDRDIIPPKLDYDIVHLGFVYSDGDPNNHRWMLNFFNKNNDQIYNIYFDEVQINCPTTSKSWHEGIWHGRFTFSKNDLLSITQPTTRKVIITGKQKEPLDMDKICSPQNIPAKASELRLRYNIREDLWFCDFLDKKQKELGTIPAKSLICDAPMKGVVLNVGNMPKVSVIIKTKDISNMAVAINSLIIRGK